MCVVCVFFSKILLLQELKNGRDLEEDSVPFLGKCLQMAKFEKSALQLFVDLLAAHDFRDTQQQARQKYLLLF